MAAKHRLVFIRAGESCQAVGQQGGICSQFTCLTLPVRTIPPRRGKESLFSRAYLHFTTTESVVAFAKAFDGHAFVDARGNEFRAVVELAPSQRIPKQQKKKDPKMGTIESGGTETLGGLVHWIDHRSLALWVAFSLALRTGRRTDPHYISFLEALNNPALPMPSLLGPTEDLPLNPEPGSVAPLVAYLREKRLNAQAAKKARKERDMEVGKVQVLKRDKERGQKEEGQGKNVKGGAGKASAAPAKALNPTPQPGKETPAEPEKVPKKGPAKAANAKGKKAPVGPGQDPAEPPSPATPTTPKPAPPQATTEPQTTSTDAKPKDTVPKRKRGGGPGKPDRLPPQPLDKTDLEKSESKPVPKPERKGPSVVIQKADGSTTSFSIGETQPSSSPSGATSTPTELKGPGTIMDSDAVPATKSSRGGRGGRRGRGRGGGPAPAASAGVT